MLIAAVLARASRPNRRTIIRLMAIQTGRQQDLRTKNDPSHLLESFPVAADSCMRFAFALSVHILSRRAAPGAAH